MSAKEQIAKICEDLSGVTDYMLIMEEDKFDKVMSALSNRLQVTQIMVTEPFYCTKKDDHSKILKVMSEKNYDIVPVKEEDKFIGYVERGLLEEKKQIEPAIQQIRFDMIVSSDTCVHEMIDLFQKSRFFFVNRKNDLVGIVTYADLDKIPVRVWLFILISRFEFLMLQLIKNFYKESSWLDKLTPCRQKEVTGLLESKRKDDVDTSLENCLYLNDMIQLLKCDEELRTFLGYTDQESCERELSGLNDLRRQVMHPPNSLVKNYEGVKTLHERVDKLQQSVKRIESALEKSKRQNNHTEI